MWTLIAWLWRRPPGLSAVRWLFPFHAGLLGGRSLCTQPALKERGVDAPIIWNSAWKIYFFLMYWFVYLFSDRFVDAQMFVLFLRLWTNTDYWIKPILRFCSKYSSVRHSELFLWLPCPFDILSLWFILFTYFWALLYFLALQDALGSSCLLLCSHHLSVYWTKHELILTSLTLIYYPVDHSRPSRACLQPPTPAGRDLAPGCCHPFIVSPTVHV